VKDQYFGDVNDFRKYGLLRALSGSTGLRLGVCWMLTDDDSRSDGNLVRYLGNSRRYRHCGPELFDWLKQVVEIERDRRTARIEESALLGTCAFQSRILADRLQERAEYFADCAERFSGCDLIFFDPDNGLEIGSGKRGRRNSCKHLYWDEVQSAFQSGASLLIYQHFIRETRSDYTARLARELRSRTGAPAVFSFSTPHVLFLLASQSRHLSALQERLAIIEVAWKNQIAVRNHPLPEH
jgi:hypothetical protein